LKLLCVFSALDTRFPFGCTASWWQFAKGLHELGHEVIAIPYVGPAIESPWWRAYPNPCQYESLAYQALKRFASEARDLHRRTAWARK
jgi:hypothetical protein